MFRIFRYAKGYWLPTLLSPICITIESIVEVIVPLLMADILNKGFGENLGTPNLETIYACGGLMVLLAACSLVFGLLSGVFATRASSGFAKNIRAELFKKINEFSFANVDYFSTSSLVTRLTTDITNIQSSFQMMIRIMFRAPILFVCALVFSFMKNVRIALIFVALCPFLLLGMIAIMSKAHPYFKTMFKKYDRMNQVVQENATGIRTVKAFIKEDAEEKKFQVASHDVRHFASSAEKMIILTNPMMQCIVAIAILSILFFGTQLITSGASSVRVGDLSLFILYAQQILSSLMMVSMVFMMILMSRASIERVFEVLDTTSDIQNPEQPIYTVKDGSITFERVCFSYLKDEEKLALKNVNLTIHSGETIGIFGSTGSSKSTLVSLIDRLYDVQSGRILVGGVDVKAYDLITLRDEVAVVLQKNVLFSGTIEENLRWGKKDASQEEMEHACQLAQAHDFITSFEDGYHHRVEQGGVNFSGGQRQRLCIARALLKRPKILILDDSTSAVDTKTDAKIRKAFQEEIPSTTKLIIAQRISSIEHADKIIFLQDGEVIAFDSHKNLLAENDRYKTIFESQQKGKKDHE